MEKDSIPRWTAEVDRTRQGGNQIIPQFIRLPKAGHQNPQTGLSRSKLNQLILPCAWNGFRPPVRSISMGAAGKKGVRLIDYASLMRYLDSRRDNQGEVRSELEVVA